MALPVQQIDHTLAALADPARRKIIDRLIEGPSRASDLAEFVAVSRPAMSKHLRTLLETGLIEEVAAEGDRRQRVYRLQREPFAALQIWLDDVHGFWTDQLTSFKQHVEKKASDP